MKTMREKFEALPEIELHLKHSNVVFSDDLSRYVSEFPMLHAVSCYVNGAWHAFQEQQKKIDEFVNIIRDAYMSDGNSSVEIVYDKIQELLK